MGDLDPQAGAMTVVKSLAELNGELWVKDTKTSNARRRVVVGFSVPHLTAHRERMAAGGRDVGPGGLIFPDTDGGDLRKSNYQRRHFAPLLQRAGLAGVKFHELRHCPTSLKLLAGVDSKTVSSRLGHGSAGFTASTYQHVVVGLRGKAAAALAGVVSAAIGHSKATVAGESGAGGKTKTLASPNLARACVE